MTRNGTAAKRKVIKVPNCSHLSMERVHVEADSHISCPVCGNQQLLGFLYECRQDDDISFLRSRLEQNPVDCASMSLVRRTLEDIGLSECVIRAAEQGEYSAEQIEQLKAQKGKLNKVVEDNQAVLRSTESFNGRSLKSWLRKGVV